MATIDDQDLLNRMLRLFRVKDGGLQPFEIAQQAVAVIDIGEVLEAVPTVVTTTEGQQGVRVGTLSKDTPLATMDPAGDPVDVDDSGIVVNPAAGLVIADTGAFGNDDAHLLNVVLSASTKTEFRIEYRNAANTATLASWTICCDVNPHSWGRTIDQGTAGERLRVVVIAAIVGDAAVAVDFTALNASTAV